MYTDFAISESGVLGTCSEAIYRAMTSSIKERRPRDGGALLTGIQKHIESTSPVADRSREGKGQVLYC